MPNVEQPRPSVATSRLHYIDAARGALMLLGIPYHASGIYMAEPSPWQVSVAQDSAIVTFVAGFLHSFRMPAFFIIAGYLAALMLARQDPTAWLRGRAMRLGTLLLTCMLLLNPLQMLVIAHHRAPGPDAWQHFRELAGRFDTLWIQHAWFLIDLILLSAMANLAWRWRRHLAAPARLVAACLAWPLLLGLAFATARLTVKVLYQLGGNFGEIGGGVLSLERLVLCAFPFLLGMLLARRPALLAQSLRLSPANTALALLAGCLTVLAGGWAGMAGKVAQNALAGFAEVLLSLLALSLAHRFLSTPSTAVRFLADASVAVYLIHFLVINLLAVVILPFGLPPLLGWAAVVLACAPICLGAHLLLARNPVLYFLFNGTPRRVPAAGPDGLVGPAGIQRLGRLR